jgi:hypothetical protein
VQTPVRLHVAEQIDPKAELPEIAITEKRDELDIEIPPPDSLKTKKAHRHLAASILTIYEISLRERTREQQREVFTKLLLALLSDW